MAWFEEWKLFPFSFLSEKHNMLLSGIRSAICYWHSLIKRAFPILKFSLLWTLKLHSLSNNFSDWNPSKFSEVFFWPSWSSALLRLRYNRWQVWTLRIFQGPVGPKWFPCPESELHCMERKQQKAFESTPAPLSAEVSLGSDRKRGLNTTNYCIS